MVDPGMSASSNTSPSSSKASRLPGDLIDPRALMALDSLELRARTVVRGVTTGLHRSPRHGFSVEFTEYRQYTPGDDLRHLDWRVFGRTDRDYVRRYEDETNLRCHLVVDQSRSMDLATQGVSKAAYGATLAATLAYFLQLQGDAVGLLTLDEAVREFIPARCRPGHLRQLFQALERASSGHSTDLATALERLADLVPRKGLVAVISDFLVPVELLIPRLRRLAACGHEVVLFQVLDPAELDFGFEQPTRFRDLETDQWIELDPSTARAGYRERFGAHQSALREACLNLGIAFHEADTRQPMERVLVSFLEQRQGARSRGVRGGEAMS